MRDPGAKRVISRGLVDLDPVALQRWTAPPSSGSTPATPTAARTEPTDSRASPEREPLDGGAASAPALPGTAAEDELPGERVEVKERVLCCVCAGREPAPNGPATGAAPRRRVLPAPGTRPGRSREAAASEAVQVSEPRNVYRVHGQRGVAERHEPRGTAEPPPASDVHQRQRRAPRAAAHSTGVGRALDVRSGGTGVRNPAPATDHPHQSRLSLPAEDHLARSG
jgi:hypothetical protein